MRCRIPPAMLSASAALVLMWHAEGIGAQPFLATGAEADVTEEGLHRVDPLIMEAAWVKPDFDLSGYDKVLLLPTAVRFRDVPRRPVNARSRINTEIFPLSESRQEWLRRVWQRAVEAEFAQEEVFELYDNVGPDVLIVQAFLVDVVSRIPPETAGSSYTLVTDPWSAFVVLELRDGTTAELLARTIDEQLVEGQAELGEVWYRTEEVIADEWAQMLSDHLRQLSELGGRDVGTPPWAR